MSLVPWQDYVPVPAAAQAAPAGAALFDTTPPQGAALNSYHVMIVCPGAARTGAGGIVELPICDMTLQGIRYPGQQDAYAGLNGLCYLGTLNGWTGEDTMQLIENLAAVRDTITAFGKAEVYSLACHGIFPEDPNNPGEFLPDPACSCASFVEHCFETAGRGHDIVDKDAVPSLHAEQLWDLLVHGHPYEQLTAERVLRKWGLKTSGPWPVLLPAYQIRAFATGSIPYAPTMGDHPYP